MVRRLVTETENPNGALFMYIAAIVSTCFLPFQLFECTDYKQHSRNFASNTYKHSGNQLLDFKVQMCISS